MTLFIPLRKADEATRTVIGWIDETPDRSREIMDYALSRPRFEKWSAEQQAASGGKSYGNLRAMHGKVAAGILSKALEYDDDNKRIVVTAQVTDDGEWQKVASGTYTGFSPGGSYGKSWPDPAQRGYMRYEAIPQEMSLVDRPCIPSAAFQFAKADGTVEDRPFDPPPYEPTNEEVRERATRMAKAAGVADKVNNFVSKARAELIGEMAADPDPPAAVEKAAPAGGTGAPPADDDPVAQLEAATAAAAELTKKDAPKPYGDVKYADPENGKYPIDTAAHIRAAWSYINMPKNQKGYGDGEVASIKSKIIAAWKDKIDSDGPPSAEKAAFLWDLLKNGQATTLVARMRAVSLEKGFYTATSVSRLLCQLEDIASSVIWEEKWEEDDDSTLPQAACDLLAATKSFLIDMLNEETAEFMEAAERNGGDAIALLANADFELSAQATDLQKLHKADGELEKVGRRNSASDMKHIQAMHDHSMAMGAKCDSGNCEKAAGADGLEKAAAVADELARSRRVIMAALPQLEATTTLVKDQGEQITALQKQVADQAALLEKFGKGPGPAKGQLVAIPKDAEMAKLEGDPDPAAESRIASDQAPDDPEERRQWALRKLAGRTGVAGPGIPAIARY